MSLQVGGLKVAVIPARGGSKRIPRKNIRQFGGRPVLAYSIEAARRSGLFDRVIVSTDDPEIEAVALSFGAEVPFRRPAELSDDHTGTNAVVKNVIERVQDGGDAVEFACCIYATAPFLKIEYLQLGFQSLSQSVKAFAFSVTSFPFPIQRSLRVAGDGSVAAIFPEFSMIRSQDVEHAYHDAGQFYWGRSESFLQGLPMYSPDSLAVMIPRHLVQDIDTLEDWRRAELMHEALQLQEARDV